MNLNAAKTLVFLADNCDTGRGRYDIPASVVYRDGWEPLGDDYWYHERLRLVAGPSLGDPTRTLVALEKVGMLQGWDAIKWAERLGFLLSKYNDPLEGPSCGLTVEEAREVAREDPSLIYLACPNCGYDGIRQCPGCQQD